MSLMGHQYPVIDTKSKQQLEAKYREFFIDKEVMPKNSIFLWWLITNKLSPTSPGNSIPCNAPCATMLKITHCFIYETFVEIIRNSQSPGEMLLGVLHFNECNILGILNYLLLFATCYIYSCAKNNIDVFFLTFLIQEKRNIKVKNILRIEKVQNMNMITNCY